MIVNINLIEAQGSQSPITLELQATQQLTVGGKVIATIIILLLHCGVQVRQGISIHGVATEFEGSRPNRISILIRCHVKMN